eukprot:TRINITY_DN1703_c1_g1_i2.p3 TRINITY_DN1703_c1_g1~~TRINITY_DN1703_c1_g1_i2.p3  ORF type:complete len:203 (-),score=-18.01 TRINITY_DN1703_c1_g1_i2:1092-1700(-)
MIMRQYYQYWKKKLSNQIMTIVKQPLKSQEQIDNKNLQINTSLMKNKQKKNLHSIFLLSSQKHRYPYNKSDLAPLINLNIKLTKIGVGKYEQRLSTRGMGWDRIFRRKLVKFISLQLLDFLIILNVLRLTKIFYFGYCRYTTRQLFLHNHIVTFVKRQQKQTRCTTYTNQNNQFFSSSQQQKQSIPQLRQQRVLMLSTGPAL